MSYTVDKLAKLSGVSVRTLHFYDEIELLKPAYYDENKSAALIATANFIHT